MDETREGVSLADVTHDDEQQGVWMNRGCIKRIGAVLAHTIAAAIVLAGVSRREREPPTRGRRDAARRDRRR